MAKYAVGDKVNIPGTVVSIHSDETGDYFEIKVKANNKMITINCEEEDISSNDSSSEEVTPSEEP